jgi:hypothetical protein
MGCWHVAAWGVGTVGTAGTTVGAAGHLDFLTRTTTQPPCVCHVCVMCVCVCHVCVYVSCVCVSCVCVCHVCVCVCVSCVCVSCVCVCVSCVCVMCVCMCHVCVCVSYVSSRAMLLISQKEPCWDTGRVQCPTPPVAHQWHYWERGYGRHHRGHGSHRGCGWALRLF